MNRKWLSFVMMLGAVLIGVVSVSAPAAATPLALPPRPTIAPPPVPSSIGAGALIVLRVATPPTGLWTVVEWQDAAGQWHPVEGWQGTLDEDQTKTWWVAEADWGKGPFRWVGYDRPDGKIWAISSSFSLPQFNRQIVEVTFTHAGH